MQCQSVLARVPEENNIAEATLDQFVRNSSSPIHIMKKGDSILDCIRDYMKAHPTVKTVLFVMVHEVLNQYKTMYNQEVHAQVFYAVKCNPLPGMLDAFATFPYASFDCASKEEMESVLIRFISPEQIVYANPMKPEEGILFMREKGVWYHTVDSPEEVEKMHRILGDDCTKCRTIIRLYVDDKHSKIPLGSKFGCHLEEAPKILETLKKYNMPAVGVSFHVGSGESNDDAYKNAIQKSHKLFDMAASYEFRMHILDLGGGWSGELGGDQLSSPALAKTYHVISETLKQEGFFDIPDLHILNEPGRYFNERAIHAVCTITHVSKKGDRIIYRINEGVYGIFKDIVLCKIEVTGIPLLDDDADPTLYTSSIVGPSFDDVDVICPDIQLPRMKVGDHILFENMGAYTYSISTTLLRENQNQVYVVRESALSQ